MESEKIYKLLKIVEENNIDIDKLEDIIISAKNQEEEVKRIKVPVELLIKGNLTGKIDTGYREDYIDFLAIRNKLDGAVSISDWYEEVGISRNDFVYLSKELTEYIVKQYMNIASKKLDFEENKSNLIFEMDYNEGRN